MAHLNNINSPYMKWWIFHLIHQLIIRRTNDVKVENPNSIHQEESRKVHSIHPSFKSLHIMSSIWTMHIPPPMKLGGGIDPYYHLCIIIIRCLAMLPQRFTVPHLLGVALHHIHHTFSNGLYSACFKTSEVQLCRVKYYYLLQPWLYEQ